MRTSKPFNNKFYQTRAIGGYSWCVNGNAKLPKENSNVLPNCVGYVCGRFNEIIGSMKYPQLNCNAENFIERAKSIGLQIADVPTLGGIMVWQRGATLSDHDGAGHVEIVERIDSANQIYTSSSNWSGPAFYNALRNNNNGRWGLANGFIFRGCIINPTIGFKPYVAPYNSSTGFFDANGWFGFGDMHPNIGKIAQFMRNVFPLYTNKKALGNYYGPYIQASIREFQKRTGLEADGNVGPLTLAKLKEYGFKE